MTDSVVAVDLFCGAGGLSTGLAKACEDLDVDVELHAINHDAKAVETHQANHGWAETYNVRVEGVRPESIVDPGDVDVLVAGPECTHYSSARGDKPVNDQRRASPDHVADWIGRTRPSGFLVENVPEFESWGPIDDNDRPTRNGKKFEAWVDRLRADLYSVDWQVLDAADYGDPTNRRRFFLIGRRDFCPEWPTQTHAEDPDEDSDREPWRTAAEVIDWSDRGYSIWRRGLRGEGKKPLVEKTMRRIAEGLRRYSDIPILEDYADELAELGKPEVREMQDDVVDYEDVGDEVEERDDPFLVDLSGDGAALAVPYILRQGGGGVPACICDPIPTVATSGAIAYVESTAYLLPKNGVHRGLHSNPGFDPTEEPLPTVTSDPRFHLVSPYLVPYYGEREGQRPRTHSVDEPMPTVTSTGSPPYLCNPYLVQYNGNSGAQSIDEPVPTVPTNDRFALCIPELYPWGLDVRYRLLEPPELAAAQGFPDDYEFKGNKDDKKTQIGNAVPVNLARSLCRKLIEDGLDATLSKYSNEQPVAADGGTQEDR